MLRGKKTKTHLNTKLLPIFQMDGTTMHILFNFSFCINFHLKIQCLKPPLDNLEALNLNFESLLDILCFGTSSGLVIYKPTILLIKLSL